jgi:hypothetical protein
LLLHLAAGITDTCFPSLCISLLLVQIDNIIHSFLCALWLCSPYEQQDAWIKVIRSRLEQKDYSFL